MPPKIIHIESNEEITSVVNRLIETDDIEIVLAVPTGARIFRDLINIKLLKREADALSKRVSILTGDESGRAHSQKAGIALYDESEVVPEIESLQEEYGEQIDDRKFFKELRESRKLGEYEARKNMILSAEGGEKETENDDEFSRLFEINSPAAGTSAPAGAKQKPSAGGGPVRQQRLADIVSSVPRPKEKRLPFGESGKIKTEPRQTRPDGIILKQEARPPFALRPADYGEPRPLAKKIFPEEKIFVPSKFSAVFNFLSSRIFTVLIAAAALVSLTTLYVILPSAEISVILKKEEKSFPFPVKIDQSSSQVDSQKNSIPGQLIQIEKTLEREFISTGRQQISDKAKGTVAIFNAYSSSPQTLVATTRFQSSDGKIFRIQKSIVVPGAKIEDGKIVSASIDAEIVADEAGEEYNIGTADFTIPGFKGTPKYSSFYAKSKTPVAGGFRGEAKVVTADDAENSRKAMIDEISDNLNSELRAKAPSELKLIPEAIKIQIIESVSIPAAGQRAEKFNYKARAKAFALLFSEKDLNKLLDGKIDEKLEAGRERMPETRKIEYKDFKLFAERGTLEVNLLVDETAVFSADKENLAQNLLGKNESEIRDYLSTQTAVESAKISFWPFWVKSVPKSSEKLKLTVQ
ncbi:MAG: hypothetical protein AAB851_01280 [Patescibacteria group bacterium]